MFGFKFEENFNYPYYARSITEFWRRWHISLSSWLRDYVYIPLGGSRVSGKRHLFNMFVVWLLTGVWHGANWTFILWGLYYFVILAIEKMLTERGFSAKLFGHIYTMFFVIIAWVIFRSTSVSDAIRFLKNMFGMGNRIFDNDFWLFLNSYKWYLVIGVIGGLPVKDLIFKESLFNTNNVAKKAGNIIYVTGMLLLVVLDIATIVKGTYNPFIYFNF